MDDGTILPPVLYEKTRGFIESLAKQINRSYEENIFDGCAVLMRRLEEVALLIMSYEHSKIELAIKDASGNYVMLERIVTDAANNATLGLGRNTRSVKSSENSATIQPTRSTTRANASTSRKKSTSTGR